MRVLFAICMIIAEMENNSNENEKIFRGENSLIRESSFGGCENGKKGSQAKWISQKGIAWRIRISDKREITNMKYASRSCASKFIMF